MIEGHAVLGKLKTAFDVLEAIESVAKRVLGNEANDAFEALHIVAVMISTLKAGFADKLSIEDVQTEIKQLRGVLLTNDAAADSALHDKFDKSPP